MPAAVYDDRVLLCVAALDWQPQPVLDVLAALATLATEATGVDGVAGATRLQVDVTGAVVEVTGAVVDVAGAAVDVTGAVLLPKIYYATRTHAQVHQVIATLKSR